MPFNGGKIGVLNQPASSAATGYYNIKDVDLYTRAEEYPKVIPEVFDYVYDTYGGTGELKDDVGVTFTAGSGSMTDTTTDGYLSTSNGLTSNDSPDTNKFLKWDFTWDDETDIVCLGMRINSDAGYTYGALANSANAYGGVFTGYGQIGYIIGTSTLRYWNNALDSTWAIYVFGGGNSVGSVDGMKAFFVQSSGLGNEASKSGSNGYGGTYKTSSGLILVSGGIVTGEMAGGSRNGMGWSMRGMGIMQNFVNKGYTYQTAVEAFHDRFFTVA